MKSIVGVCGYFSSGSSAFVDLLHEFDETQVFDNLNFNIIKASDGLMDLEHQLSSYRYHKVSVIAIQRFRSLLK